MRPTFNRQGRTWSIKAGDLVDMSATGASGLNPDTELRLENTGHPAADSFTLARASRSRIKALGLSWRDDSGVGIGYFLVWSAFSAVAAVVQWWLHETAVMSPAMVVASSQIGAAILIGAGIYQLTPLKAACLTHCRGPLAFVMSHWRDGTAGAVRMGMRHGWYCVGCCWALMCVLFAVGVMNLLWVAALSIIVLAEKLIPGGPWLAQAGGVAMIVAGVLRVFVS